MQNTLYYGDNLTIMQEKLGKDAVDLIYLDPPFKSDATYNLLYRKLTGKPVPEQAEAFFGHQNFRSEIVWKRTGSHGSSKRWGPVHDTIFFYSKTDNYTWNRTFQQYDPDYIRDAYRNRDERGAYQLVSLTGAGTRTGD